MSAFTVAIGAKADMSFCTAYVCLWPKADISRVSNVRRGNWRKLAKLWPETTRPHRSSRLPLWLWHFRRWSIGAIMQV